ncbi:MAG: type IV pili methyl-accepting chemotaxis transducer N-terminal domain-containing protein [Aliarcobacter sp.]|nr:type IV pili methyl-accepting chemotaxis transducer N-terminal domain-containing protein [Aliarcobacter sp.]
MKENTITRKIKLIGILFIILMLSIIATTIYLNEKSKNHASIINIAGKQRMLSQKISKNIFYLFYNESSSTELNEAIEEFTYNLDSLKNGNTKIKISKIQNFEINAQLLNVERLWNDFYTNINAFKENIDKKDNLTKLFLEDIFKTIYNTNITLLNEIDILVSLYTKDAEEKTDCLRNIQYFFVLLIFSLFIYSFSQLKAMEANAKKFFEYSKKIVDNPSHTPLKPIKIVAEKEITDATDTINSFINKINSAMSYSTSAVEQSKNAFIKLEEITDEFDIILNELKDSTEISKRLDKSEEIVIQTQEELIKSTKKLQTLKEELDFILTSCKIK